MAAIKIGTSDASKQGQAGLAWASQGLPPHTNVQGCTIDMGRGGVNKGPRPLSGGGDIRRACAVFFSLTFAISW